MYIYERPEWPHFTWQHEKLEPLLGTVRYQQGRRQGHMEALGFSVQLRTWTISSTSFGYMACKSAPPLGSRFITLFMES